MLSLFLRKLKFDLGQSLAQEHFYTFLNRKITFHNESNISTFDADPNDTLTYRARLRLCCRTSSTVMTTEITCTFLRIRFTYTSCVQLDVLNVYVILIRPVCKQARHPKHYSLFSVRPFGPFNCTFDPTIRIRITYTFNVVAPLACPFNPLYLYV